MTIKIKKCGWWKVKFELELDGKTMLFDELDDVNQAYICDAILEGYTSGELSELNKE